VKQTKRDLRLTKCFDSLIYFLEKLLNLCCTTDVAVGPRPFLLDAFIHRDFATRKSGRIQPGSNDKLLKLMSVPIYVMPDSWLTGILII
jgi:hypothetical protein